MYGCTPTALAEQPDETVRLHLSFQGMEARVKAEREKAMRQHQSRRAKKKGG